MYHPESDSSYIISNMLRKHRRLKKLRRLLGLPEKNMYISPGVYTQERDWSYVTKNN